LLTAFAGTLYAILEAEEAAEPPLIKALEPPDQTGTRVLYALAAALPVALVVAVGGAIFIARRGLLPLDDVVATAERVGADNLAARIPPRPGAVDEVARLVASLNAMLQRLEAVGGRNAPLHRRRLPRAAHAAAALMGELEVTLRHPRSEEALRKSVEDALEELGRLSRLVEGLLMLARSDAGGLPVSAVDLDLGEVVKRAAEPYEAVLAARRITLLRHDGAPVRAHADPLWVGPHHRQPPRQCVQFTPEGGAVTLRLSGTSLEVHNDGPGVPAADSERIFERFYRGPSARGATDGFGLGLPLAREIARALGGELRLAAGPGRRSCWSCRPPALEPAPLLPIHVPA